MPSWSCDQDHLNKLSFLRPKEFEFLSLICTVVSEEKMFENVDRQRDALVGYMLC